MRILFWGTPEYSVASLDILNKSDHELVAVISQPDKKRSRGNKLISSPVKKYAIRNKIPFFTPNNIKGNFKFINQIKDLSCDIFVVVAYGKILPKEILELPKFGCWNAHASLLPRWRGAAPIQWSLLEGDKYTGVGIMKMDEGLDTGDILVEKTIRIENDDNFISLTQKLSLLSSKLFITLLSKLEKNNHSASNFELTKQINIEREIKYARMIYKSDYKIDWKNKAIDIQRQVKGLYPRVYTMYNGKNLKIIKIKILKTDEFIDKKNKQLFENVYPGLIIDLIDDEGIVISTKTEPIVLLEAKPKGKNISSRKQLIQQL